MTFYQCHERQRKHSKQLGFIQNKRLDCPTLKPDQPL